MAALIDQKGATAGGDIVGRDKIETHYHNNAAASVVEKLLAKLQSEVAANQQVQDTIEALAYFRIHKSHDGIDGLEAKLNAGQRGHEYIDAIEKKELFAKLLARWSLYASAQELFAYLLAKIEYEFKHFILPQVNILNHLEINQLIKDRVIVPTIDECGSTVFTLNHGGYGHGILAR